MKKGIIFDMDGTLWDSTDVVAKSWTDAVKEWGLPDKIITPDDMRGVMGLTMDRIAMALFSEIKDEEQIKLLDYCCKIENEYIIKFGGVLYPDLEETWTKLKENGYHLYIVSNCQKGYIEAFLEHYGFGHYFEDIECFGNNGLKKGDNIRNVVTRNNLDYAIYVGDIQGDYDATMEAGAEFIHAAYGFGTINAEVRKINKFSDLQTI
ncbi:MAG: HAD family hydrolase [Lachnospiraceae bacterium]|nr:HAD family hydrolase [Lachnospiraceae bacterium]